MKWRKQPEFVWWNRECNKVIRIRKAKLFKWKYCKTEEIFLEYKRVAISAKHKFREIKQEHWETFCDRINEFTNLPYIWDRMKRLICRYKKTEREHEFNTSWIRQNEKPYSGVDEQTQAPAFHHDNQEPFLDSEYKIQELHFAIRNLRVQSRPGRDEVN
jgi:hypothetical protein